MYMLLSKSDLLKVIIFTLLFHTVFTKTDSDVGNKIFLQQIKSRRIILGKEVGETRPYMVYLRPSPSAPTGTQALDTNWMCGGAIIHERYILTSAACIEDAKNFYVVSGTNKWVPPKETSECITNGAKKAVWKCVPKDYFFDGAEFENIRWMSGDIAVVKVEDDFNFNKRIRGCDYVPQKIAFNNVSADYEKAGTEASIAGWGSSERYGDVEIARTTVNSKDLLETDVELITKKNCKKRWDPRYHHIIEESMLCTKDDQDGDIMSSACLERGIHCKELEYSMETEDKAEAERYRRVLVPDGSKLSVQGASQYDVQPDGRKRAKVASGGFCENDHGGPLVTGHGKTSIVIGVMSACMTKDVTKKCYGPFLYTSVWKYRYLISCAIDKEIGSTCRRSLKTSRAHIYEVDFDWSKHPDGPAKTDHTELPPASKNATMNASIDF